MNSSPDNNKAATGPRTKKVDGRAFTRSAFHVIVSGVEMHAPIQGAEASASPRSAPMVSPRLRIVREPTSTSAVQTACCYLLVRLEYLVEHGVGAPSLSGIAISAVIEEYLGHPIAPSWIHRVRLRSIVDGDAAAGFPLEVCPSQSSFALHA